MFNLIEIGLESQRMSRQSCRCDAYKFPHRPGGGDCIANEPVEMSKHDKFTQAMIDSGHKPGDFY